MLPAVRPRPDPPGSGPAGRKFACTQVECSHDSGPDAHAPADAPAPAETRCARALRAVIDPELGDTIVDLGMVRADRRRRATTSSSMSP